MKQKRAYVVTAEKAIGRELPFGSVVHHVDQDRSNNANNNLVILQSTKEHAQLHRRLRTLRAGGNPWTDQICCTCRAVKPLSDYPPSKRVHSSECLPCSAERNIARYHASKGRAARRLTKEEKSEIQRQIAFKRWRAPVGGALRRS